MPCIQAEFLNERSNTLVDRYHLGLEFMHNNFIACVSVASLLSSINFLASVLSVKIFQAIWRVFSKCKFSICGVCSWLLLAFGPNSMEIASTHIIYRSIVF